MSGTLSHVQTELKLLPSSVADTPQTCVIHITQLERDTILVCLDSE